MFPASEMTRVVCCVVDNFLCCVEVPAPGTTQLNEMCVCVYVCVCGGGGGGGGVFGGGKGEQVSLVFLIRRVIVLKICVDNNII